MLNNYLHDFLSHVLVEEVIAREHKADGRGEGESAVAAIGREALVAAVGGDHGGEAGQPHQILSSILR